MRRAVFLDKDGTLVEDVPYNVDPARVRLASQAGPALARLRKAGFHLYVVSNQPGVAFGHFRERELSAVEGRINELLARERCGLDGFFYCPHHPEGSVRRYRMACDCRKPAPGLLFAAAGSCRIELSSSWMVGDILDDMEAGCRAGCRTILVDNGNETEWLDSRWRRPEYRVGGLLEAAEIIISHSRTRIGRGPARADSVG